MNRLYSFYYMCGNNRRILKEKQSIDIDELKTDIRMIIQEINCQIEMQQLKTEIANELIDFINIILLKHSSCSIIEKR